MEKVGFFRREVLGLPVCAAVTRAGGDLLVQITGGCAEHIGSVSTAYFEDGERRLEPSRSASGRAARSPSPAAYTTTRPGTRA